MPSFPPPPISSSSFRPPLEPALLPADIAAPEMRTLLGMVEILESNLPFAQVLEKIFDAFRSYIPYIHIGVALLEDGGQTIRASYGVTAKNRPNLARKLVGLRAQLNATSLGRVLESGKPRIIEDLPGYLAGRQLAKYNRLLLETGVRSSITFPLRNGSTPVGILFFSSDRPHAYTRAHLQFLQLLANSLMLSLEKTILLDDMIVGSSLALATLTEERDDSTGGHLHRMQRYSRFIAELLAGEDTYADQVDFEFIRSIERFSPLHDIGKVAIPDRILLKPGRLTAEEFELMKSHTTYGAQVLRRADENIRRMGHSIFAMGIEIAQSHHERWDGLGYPQGLRGREIPLSARIVTIADVFDALTSRRVYKKAYDFDTSFRLVIQSIGRQFDPKIIGIVKENRERLRQLYDSCRKEFPSTIPGPEPSGGAFPNDQPESFAG